MMARYCISMDAIHALEACQARVTFWWVLMGFFLAQSIVILVAGAMIEPAWVYYAWPALGVGMAAVSWRTARAEGRHRQHILDTVTQQPCPHTRKKREDA